MAKEVLEPRRSTGVVTEMRLDDSEVEFYNNYGYLVLPGLVKTDCVGLVHAEVMEIMRACLGLSAEDLGRATGGADRLRQCSQYLRGSHLDEMINGETMLSLAGQLLGGVAHPYMPFSAVKAGGGGGTFDLHQDNNYTKHEPASGTVNIWVALVDMTPENGALLMAPRSHLRGIIPSVNAGAGDHHQKIDFDVKECVPLRMRAGDAVAFSRLTVHGSGPNFTSDPRVAYALTYHRSDVMWVDEETGERRSLLHDPKWDMRAVETLKRMG